MSPLSRRWAALLTAFWAIPALAAPCTKEATRNAQLDTAGATKIVIAARAGDLRISGERGRNQLVATGQACASNQALLDKIQLEGRREGNTVIVKAVLPETEGFLGYARLDLKIVVPDNIELSVDDSSGDTYIENVRALTLTDSSGDLEVRSVNGDLSVNDSSGDIRILQVAGNVKLTDSSGDIDVKQVSGTVKVEADSSGGIEIDNAGSVQIVTDSSGDITIEKVRADVLIDNDSSGDISVADVGGKFVVGADSSGSIRHERVAGTVSVPH
jgi:hypothetical protein